MSLAVLMAAAKAALRGLPGAMLLGTLAIGTAHADGRCGSLLNAVGPWDYRTATTREKDLVERFHFNSNIESLALGRGGSVSNAADISYTLKAFPNHPRALLSMAQLGLRDKTPHPKGSPYSIDCWFERAMEFRPDDGQVRLIYGITLLKAGRPQDAIQKLEQADRLLPNDPNVQYNLGLAYFDTKDYDKSLEHAKKAYALGFPLPGLRDKLQRIDKWQ
jgi:tetratricopeptide (TPR) repeat protein